MQEAIERGGLFRGVLLGADRITRCHSRSSPQGPAEGTARRTGGLIQDSVAWYLQPATCTVPGSERSQRVNAALLSAILPGAGKAYCGRGADGLQSLLIVGTAALLAARGFERNGRRSLEGWGAAGVGAVFYAGGIVGAAASVDLRGGRDAEKRPRVRTSRAGSGTSGALDLDLGDAGIAAGDGAGTAAVAGAGGSRTPSGSVRAQPATDRGAAAHGISPTTAVLFSSIVPGSGQMLSGSFGRGVNALVLDVGLGAGVGVLARDGRFVEAALLFSLGFLRYYHGNLYWAARLAAERSGRPEMDPGPER
jgi:TM2 domain-containing membrane protein YozV